MYLSGYLKPIFLGQNPLARQEKIHDVVMPCVLHLVVEALAPWGQTGGVDGESWDTIFVAE